MRHNLLYAKFLKLLWIIPVFLNLFVVLNPIFPAKRPKVIIFIFANVDQDPNAAYLESTITDAVRKELNRLFVFKEISEQKVNDYAVANYFKKEDFHTYSVGMQLGLALKQDVVIQGHFRLRKKKKDITLIETHVRIIDIGHKKIVAEFDTEGAADASIFDSIAALTRRMSEEAKAVLPNEAEWKKQGVEDDNDDRPLFNQVAIIGGICAFT